MGDVQSVTNVEIGQTYVKVDFTKPAGFYEKIAIVCYIPDSKLDPEINFVPLGTTKASCSMLKPGTNITVALLSSKSGQYSKSPYQFSIKTSQNKNYFIKNFIFKIVSFFVAI